MSVPAQQPAPDALTSAESPDTSWGTSPASAASPSGGRASGPRSSEALLPRHTSHERFARVAAVILLAIVCVAVVWPSGREVAELKDTVGPAFLSSEGKDVVLNLVGCVVGLSAEVLQGLLPMLERRPSLANVGQNAVGAWAGALAAWYLLRRLHARVVEPTPVE